MSLAQQRLRARYGDDAHTPEAACTALIEQLLDHRSVRAYLPDAVSEEMLAAIIAAAQSAASSSNLQAWSVVAVREAATRAALADCAGDQAHMREAPLQLVWLADLARLARLGAQTGRPVEALDYTEMLLVGVIDAALAAQNAAAAFSGVFTAVVLSARRLFPPAAPARPRCAGRDLVVTPRRGFFNNETFRFCLSFPYLFATFS